MTDVHTSISSGRIASVIPVYMPPIHPELWRRSLSIYLAGESPDALDASTDNFLQATKTQISRVFSPFSLYRVRTSATHRNRPICLDPQGSNRVLQFKRFDPHEDNFGVHQCICKVKINSICRKKGWKTFSESARVSRRLLVLFGREVRWSKFWSGMPFFLDLLFDRAAGLKRFQKKVHFNLDSIELTRPHSNT